ncbi:DUF6350 family protein [Demequina sp. NBRC 110056]|uniref:cell division protein PerM n=1 Tax=Demequina sp. NBRC 110056 TaxID=1570345 RepID=UPI000A067562|nr:DUF6350 family protein [Demequina sp. NBRC 110056]
MSTRSLASDLRALGRRGIAAVMAAPAWLGGILTGLQGAVLSYLLVLAPTMAVVAASPEASTTTGVDWGVPAVAAARVWLLGHGLPVEIGGATVSLVPLGLTLVCGAIIAAIARRFAARTWGSWGLAVATYAALVTVATSAVLLPEERDAAPVVTVVAVALAGVATAIGVWRAHGVELGWLARVPEVVRAGLRRGAGVSALALCVAAAVQTVWAVQGRLEIGAAATALDTDVVGAAVLAAGETVYAPTMVVWALAWLTGQGFSVGTGTAYAPDALTVDALPSVPILGALPSASGGLLVWAPVLLVVTAAAVRVVLARRSLGWRDEALADLVALGTVAAIGAGMAVAATGSAGPGRFAEVGPDPLPVAAALVGLTAAGLVVGTFVALAMRFVRGLVAPSRPAAPVSATVRTPARDGAKVSAGAAGTRASAPMADGDDASDTGDATSAQAGERRSATIR